MCMFIGAGSGIGRATCQVLAREGANVVAADRNEESAMQTVTTISKDSVPNQHHLPLILDVAQSASIKDALKTVVGVFKKSPSIIVNCAGITRDNFLLKLSEADFDEVIDVNLKVL